MSASCRKSGALPPSASPSQKEGRLVQHKLPAFQWLEQEQRWCKRPNQYLPPGEMGSIVIEEIAISELPLPRYQSGDEVTFAWKEGEASDWWEGIIVSILLRGIYSYFTVGGVEEQEGARHHAITRSYHTPHSIEYLVWTKQYPTCYVQEDRIRLREVQEEKEEREATHALLHEEEDYYREGEEVLL